MVVEIPALGHADEAGLPSLLHFVLPYQVQYSLVGIDNVDADLHAEGADDSPTLRGKNYNIDSFWSSFPGDYYPPVQRGQLAPKCLMPDGVTHDGDCVSGPLWALDNGHFLC